MPTRLRAVLLTVVAALVAGLAVGAPARAAGLPPPTVAPTSVVVGGTTVVSGTGCFGVGGGSAVAAWLTDATGATLDGTYRNGSSAADGTWSLRLTVPLRTPAGQTLVVASSCGYSDLGTYQRYPDRRLDVLPNPAAPWQAQPVPLPDVPNGRLTGVSCATTTACVAVGTARRAGVDVPLAETLAAGTWSLSTVPEQPDSRGASLVAVSCTDPAWCLAVGSVDTVDGVRPLVATRTAGTWQTRVLPVPGDNPNVRDAALTGVSCPTTSRCVAVGRSGDFGSSAPFSSATAYVLRGTTWSPAPPTSGHNTDTASVSCRTLVTCVAVWSDSIGAPTDPVQRFDGTRWTVAPLPDATTRPRAVSCPAAGSCVVVGVSTDGRVDTPLQPWAARLDTAGWTTLPLRTAAGGDVGTGELTAVSCASPTVCVAVGRRGSLLAPGDAFSVRRVDATWTPAAAPKGSLPSAVSCAKVTTCTAVGSRGGVPLVVRGTGAAWSVTAAPAPGGLPDAGLAGVACAQDGPDTACTVVGRYVDARGVGRPLVDRWTSGSGWTLAALPDLPGGRLTGVSCPSTTSCTAVGRVEVGTRPAQLLVLQWDGTTGWTRVTAFGATGLGYLTAVSCGAVGSCLAVGTDVDRAPVVLSSTAGTWTRAANPPTGDLTRVVMPSVSCVGTTCRTAVSSGFGDGALTEYGLVWDAGRWSADPPRSAIAGAVSCWAAERCVQVLVEPGGPPSALTVDGDDRTLTELPVDGTGGVVPTALACTGPGRCVSVGGSDLGSSVARTTAGGWALQPVSTPVPGVGSLQGVACLPTSGRCMAVGGGDGEDDGPPVVLVDA